MGILHFLPLLPVLPVLFQYKASVIEETEKSPPHPKSSIVAPLVTNEKGYGRMVWLQFGRIWI